MTEAGAFAAPARAVALRPAQFAEASELFARAFMPNPMTLALYGAQHARRLRRARAGMAAAMAACARGQGPLLGLQDESGRLVAAALGTAPGPGTDAACQSPEGRNADDGNRAAPGAGSAPGLPAPFASGLRHSSAAEVLRLALGTGPRAFWRTGRLFSELERLHPGEPHWTLAFLGVLPGAQGMGLGRVLLAAFLEETAARARLPVYLETDLPRNVRFYRSMGFVPRASVRPLDVPVTTMWREQPALCQAPPT